MKKQFYFLLLLLLGIAGFDVSAQIVTTNLHLSPGSAAVLMSYSAGEYTFYQYLGEGDNIVEYDKNKYLYMTPAPGAETISVDPEDDYVKRSKAGMEQFSIRFSAFMKEKYTVTTTGTPSLPTTHIVLASGAKARVLEQNQRTFEYTLHAALTEGDNPVGLAMDAADNPGTVPFYRLCGEEGYILDQVTDGDGNPVEVKQDSYLGNYIELTAFTFLPVYNVTTKERPAPSGDPVFILTDGSHAYYTPFGGGAKTTLNPGNNYAELSATDIIQVYPADGFHFTSFTNGSGASLDISRGYVQIDAGYSFQPPYYISTEANSSDPVLTLNVDDPSTIKCEIAPSYRTVSLRPGENKISFSAYTDKYIIISRKAYNDYTDIYSVKVNGVEQQSSYEHWLDLADGMQIDVLVNYPDDVTHTYTLDYADGAEGFWTSVMVGGKEVTPVDNKFEAPAGATVDLFNTNATDWLISDITLPGGAHYTSINDPYSPLSFTANSDGTIRVDARKAQNLYITVNVISGSDKIQVVNGNWNTGRDLVGLTDGANAVTIKDNVDYLLIRHLEENGIISSITYRESPEGELKPAVRSNYYPYYYTVSGLRNGAEVNIIAGDVDYVNTCTFYVDKAEGLTFSAEAGRSFSLNDGYNTVIFNETENGANGFAIYGAPESASLFCNGVKAASAARVKLAQDGIYKLYTATADPQPMAVTFNVCDGGYAVTDVTVDLTVPVTDITAPFDVLPATRMTFRVSVPEGLENHVDANGDELETTDEGIYSLDIDAPTVITVGKRQDGITVTAADAAADTDATWFDLAGRRIAAERLAPGLYIRVAAGRADKVAVK